MNSYNETLDKRISELNLVEFSNIQFNRSDGIKDFSSLLNDIFCGHFIAKISMDFSKVEGSNGPGAGMGDEKYISHLLDCPKFQELIPGYDPDDNDYDFNMPVTSSGSSLYPLLGDLCGCIDGGGYSGSNKLPPDELIATTKKFIDEFLPSGY